MDIMHIVRSVRFSTVQSFSSFNTNYEHQRIIQSDLPVAMVNKRDGKKG